MAGKNKPIKVNIKMEKPTMINARTELIFTT